MNTNLIRIKLIGLQDFVNKRIDFMASDSSPDDVAECLREISRESGRLSTAITLMHRARKGITDYEL